MKIARWAALGAAFAGTLAVSASAQRVYTDHDYAQAERWMGYNTVALVHHTIGGVEYLDDGRVFYRDPSAAGVLYYLADPAKGTKALAFDNARLAKALKAAIDSEFDPKHLGASKYRPEANGGFAITVQDKVFHCDAPVSECHMEAAGVEKPQPTAKVVAPPAETGVPQAKAKSAVPKPALKPAKSEGEEPPINVSPDGKLGVFVRDWNLWLKVMATGEERQLTTDGVENFGYATDNAGWQHSDAAISTWSKDGRMIATFQQDQRKVKLMYLVPVTNTHPKLEAWPYPLLGDANVTKIEPVVIDVPTGQMVRLKTAPLEHRSMECDDVSCDGDSRWTDAVFSGDDRHLAFVSTSRNHKDEWVEEADTVTGAVREVYHEHVPTYYGWQAKTDWKYMPQSNEFLWVSERSNYAQVYLYDLTTGKLKNQVTHGDGPVWDFASVDEKHRVLYFTATGKVPGENPYNRELFRVDFDGKHQELLTEKGMNHDVTMAPDASSFVDVASTVGTPETAVVRDSSGKELMPLAKQDISALTAEGWKPPMQIKVKARDGRTELYGLLFRPTNFDPAKKYPVVDYIYPGPQDAACSLLGMPAFRAARGDMQSLADLGFVTVCIDGMGNPHRSKSFHDAHASKPADMGDDTIPDQVAGIKDLAQQFSWIDLDRVGIWGHSGGGNATASAMFHFPDFFKVGWAESGNHDNRDYEDDWDERWAGLETWDANGVSNYEPSANQNYVQNLKGHLMLVHGTMDDNVPPNNTLLVVQALMKANKNFDMLMVPNVPHGYQAMTPYIMRRRWDYFVRYLAGGVPPAEYQMTSWDKVVQALYSDR